MDRFSSLNGLRAEDARARGLAAVLHARQRQVRYNRSEYEVGVRVLTHFHIPVSERSSIRTQVLPCREASQPLNLLRAQAKKAGLAAREKAKRDAEKKQ